ncbi:MAG: hypothetical protein ACFNZX_10925 [Actinomyces sp.]
MSSPRPSGRPTPVEAAPHRARLPTPAASARVVLLVIVVLVLKGPVVGIGVCDIGPRGTGAADPSGQDDPYGSSSS